MDSPISSKLYQPYIPGKQDVNKDVNIINKRATLIAKNILGGVPLTADTTTPVHANQTADPLASKSDHVASYVWKGESSALEKPPLPPRKREREAARKAQLEAYARQMAPDANIQLNSVGVINVKQLEKAGYTFHKELGICLSADGKTAVELDVLNQTKQDVLN